MPTYHITHVDNLDDPMQQHTVYTNEVDASLFTTDTTIPCNYNISVDMSNPNSSHENKSNTNEESIPKVNIHTEMFLVRLTSNIMILIMVMHSLYRQIYGAFTTRTAKSLLVFTQSHNN